jgi:hypothetical protein
MVPFALGFATRADGTLDTSPPVYEGSTPEDEANGVSAQSAVRLLFDEPVDLVEALDDVSADDGATPGTLSVEGNDLIFTPSAPWSAGAHSVYIRDAYDLAGNRRYINRRIDFTVP